MAQEPSSRELLEAVKQQESGGRRYKADGKTLLEGPPTKYGTAKGEMQVLDMTNRDPGFGVRPAKDDSPDERARVGRDYLAAMTKRYGDTETGLIAYNWGPGNTDKWIKKGADPAKLPKETQNYVTKIMASLGSTKVAGTKAAPVKAAPTKVAETKAAPTKVAETKVDIPPRRTGAALLQNPLFSQLGPSYQAAMAVSILADEAEKEDKDEDAPSESEKMLAAMPSAPAAVELDLGYQSPFPEVQAQAEPAKPGFLPMLRPVRMAEGGEVEDRVEDPQMMANKTTELQGYKTKQPDGTNELWGPDVPVSRSAKELKAYTEALNPAVKTFTGGLGMGTRGYIYPDQPDIINLNTALTPGEREITTLHELEHSMDARGGDIYGRPKFALMGGMDNNYRAYSLMGDDWTPITATVKNMVDNREKLEKFFGRPLDNSYFRKDSYDNLKKVGKTKALFSEQIASLAALEQTTGKFLTQDPEMRELFPSTRMMAVYDALTGPRQTRMDARDLPPHTPVPSYTYEQNPTLRFIKKSLTGKNEYGTSYRPFPIKRAKGSPETGEVGYFQDPFGVPDSGPVTSDTLSKGKEFSAADALRVLKEMGTDGARNIKNIAKGTTETPYNLVGSVADIGNMVLTPLGLGSAEPFLGSAQLKRLATEAGIRPAPPTDPRDAGFYMMGELGSSVLNPAGVVRSGVKATGKAADLLRDLKKPKEVPQTAPAPAPMAGPTPEVLTELARMSEQRQLPRNAAQAPDPLIGVRPTLAEAQANVAARQAEQLPPPPAEVVVPPEMLEMPPVAPPMQATAESVVRPFTGRLDSFVETIKNPVQLGQLKGQLKGKFRDYDLERVERAFAGMDDKTKLTPDQIKQALAGVHSPGKWISETLPPEKGKYHQNMDNIWGKELGTTNLYLEQPEQTLLATKLFDEGGTSLGAFVANSTTTPTLKKLEDAKKLLSNPDLTKFANPDLVSRISAKLDTAENNIKLIDQFGQDIQNIERGFARPVLFQQNGESVWFKFKDDFIKGKKTEIEQQFMDQGMTRSQALSATHDKLFGNNNAVYLAFVREAEIASSKKVQDLAREQARSHSINIPDLGINWSDPLLKPMDPLSVTTSVNAQTDRAQAALKTALEPSVQTVHEASKNVQRFMSDDVKELGLVLQNAAAYRGKHKGVAASPYPIGFTRFSEHEATVPGMGTVQGRHFHELQSDLSKDMRKFGTTFGSEQKDITEGMALTTQIQKHRLDAFNELSRIQKNFKDGVVTYGAFKSQTEKINQKLEEQVRSLEKRYSILNARVGDKAPYSLQEPFAGFETNPMVRQQLLMKNAIQSAMRDGKSFATFPGNESAKPQLYVGKVQPNLKQVIKDLGGEKSGLELRQIELPPDKDGNSITATGVVWSPEAAARIMKTGVPFAKGGMVQGYAKGGIANGGMIERQFTDNRRYM